MFAPSWKAPSEVAPSPKNATANRILARSRRPQARPAACGTWVAIGTQIDATLRRPGSTSPTGCPRHHCKIVEAGKPRSRPIADSR